MHDKRDRWRHLVAGGDVEGLVDLELDGEAVAVPPRAPRDEVPRLGGSTGVPRGVCVGVVGGWFSDVDQVLTLATAASTTPPDTCII